MICKVTINRDKCKIKCGFLYLLFLFTSEENRIPVLLEPAVLVLPSGSRGKPVVRKPRKKGARRRSTNNDVGFIQEFGAPRRNIPGKQWMAQANAECADAVTTAEFGVYDDWLKSKDL